MFVETGVCGFASGRSAMFTSRLCQYQMFWKPTRTGTPGGVRNVRARPSTNMEPQPGRSTNKNLKGRIYFINSSAASVAP